MTDPNPQRELARERTEAYRERRRHGRVLVPVEVSPQHLGALERLALLDAGERDKACIAWAVERFLDAAPPRLGAGRCAMAGKRESRRVTRFLF